MPRKKQKIDWDAELKAEAEVQVSWLNAMFKRWIDPHKVRGGRASRQAFAKENADKLGRCIEFDEELGGPTSGISKEKRAEAAVAKFQREFPNEEPPKVNTLRNRLQ